MSGVFSGGVAEPALCGVRVDFRPVSSEPAVACDELDQFAEGRATELRQSHVCAHSGDPLFGLGGIRLYAVRGGGPVIAPKGPFFLPAFISAAEEGFLDSLRVMKGAWAEV